MSPTDLRRRLAWLIGIRAAVGTALLGSGVLAQLTAPGVFPVSPFFLLIGLTYALTLIDALTLRFTEKRLWLVDLQLAGDALIVSGVIAVTGGVTSYFSLLFVLPIVAASMLLRRRGALTVAIFSGVTYAGVVLAQYGLVAGIPGHPWPGTPVSDLPPANVAFYTVGVNILAFMAVGWLSGSLAESLRRTGVRLERASSELADLQALNQHVIDSLVSGLVTTDYGRRVVTFNPAAEVITGHPAGSVIGRAVTEVLQLPAEFAESLTPDLKGGTSRRADYQYRTPDGRLIEVGLSATHLLTSTGRAGLLFTFQDTTEIRRLERDARLRQRLAAIGEMAAGIAHEIRNPLASMSGSIQVLRQELSLSDEQAQLMDIVLRESERLNATISNFLAYARPQRFEIGPVDVARVLGDTALLLRNSAEVSDKHEVNTEAPNEPVVCEADEGQVRQIVWNLAINGLRAMPDGGRLSLSAMREARQGDGAGAADVVLRVRDEGVGIPAGELDGLFQPFRGKFGRGSGLGLAIVHRIVSDYNGEIQVTSEPGTGTTVTVRLPAGTIPPRT